MNSRGYLIRFALCYRKTLEGCDRTSFLFRLQPQQNRVTSANTFSQHTTQIDHSSGIGFSLTFGLPSKIAKSSICDLINTQKNRKNFGNDE